MATVKQRAAALLEQIGSLTAAARTVAHKDGKPAKAEVTALEEAEASVLELIEIDHTEALDADREQAAAHLEHLADTVYEGQSSGALRNAANDLRSGTHIKPEPEVEAE